tara:strand:+ start:3638 stop:3997 length:360 start_codon:yes stop_codon:yes gene_type:complete
MKNDEGGHWYTACGKPRHWQPDGKKTTLRHARKQNLFPSVTGVIKEINNEFLNGWRVKTATLRAKANPAFKNESDDMYLLRINVLNRDDKNSILEFGTRIHAALEKVNLHFQNEARKTS